MNIDEAEKIVSKMDFKSKMHQRTQETASQEIPAESVRRVYKFWLMDSKQVRDYGSIIHKEVSFDYYFWLFYN